MTSAQSWSRDWADVITGLSRRHPCRFSDGYISLPWATLIRHDFEEKWQSQCTELSIGLEMSPTPGCVWSTAVGVIWAECVPSIFYRTGILTAWLKIWATIIRHYGDVKTNFISWCSFNRTRRAHQRLFEFEYSCRFFIDEKSSQYFAISQQEIVLGKLRKYVTVNWPITKSRPLFQWRHSHVAMALARLVKDCSVSRLPNVSRLRDRQWALAAFTQCIGYRCKLFKLEVYIIKHRIHMKNSSWPSRVKIYMISMLTDGTLTCHVVRHRFFERENFHVDTSSDLADALWPMIELTLSTIMLKK